MKYGKSGNKQTYFCKDCHRKFRESSLLKKARFNPEFVTLCLDLYFSGLSLRKIARTVANHFNIDVDFSTIYRWIQKYVPMVSEYVNSLAPQISKTWHADELFVKVRGGTHRGNNRGNGVLWNILDRETRFLIVSKLTLDRGIDDTIAAFREAAKNAHGITPNKVYTDSLRHYNNGIAKNFPDAERITNCGITKTHANNNRVERLNGTLRERTKVSRGWKTGKTPIAEGQRIHYNFVKPHQALEGITPAQTSGMTVEGQNKWLALLKGATK
jgi:transposase-like protein